VRGSPSVKGATAVSGAMLDFEPTKIINGRKRLSSMINKGPL
jgi:hypothetical protein